MYSGLFNLLFIIPLACSTCGRIYSINLWTLRKITRRRSSTALFFWWKKLARMLIGRQITKSRSHPKSERSMYTYSMYVYVCLNVCMHIQYFARNILCIIILCVCMYSMYVCVFIPLLHIYPIFFIKQR